MSVGSFDHKSPRNHGSRRDGAGVSRRNPIGENTVNSVVCFITLSVAGEMRRVSEGYFIYSTPLQSSTKQGKLPWLRGRGCRGGTGDGGGVTGGQWLRGTGEVVLQSHNQKTGSSVSMCPCAGQISQSTVDLWRLILLEPNVGGRKVGQSDTKRKRASSSGDGFTVPRIYFIFPISLVIEARC